MNTWQFNQSWGVLCRNFSKDVESEVMKKKEEDYYRSFKHAHPKDFDNAVNNLINDVDRIERKNGYETFPTVGELRRYIKASQKLVANKQYDACTACGNSGKVSIILGKKIGTSRIFSRHFYKPGLLCGLTENQTAKDEEYYSIPKCERPKDVNNIGIIYYNYDMFCLCDKGRALKNSHGCGVTIEPYEYDELLNHNKKVL